MQDAFHMLLYHAFHAQRGFLRSCLGRSGLGAGQPKLLVYLYLHGPCSQRELASYFEIDPAAVCRMLASLEQNGFVERAENETCRRTDRVCLTEQGLAEAKTWQENYLTMDSILLRGFSEQEREQFASFLARACGNFHAKKEDDACGT